MSDVLRERRRPSLSLSSLALSLPLSASATHVECGLRGRGGGASSGIWHAPNTSRGAAPLRQHTASRQPKAQSKHTHTQTQSHPGPSAALPRLVSHRLWAHFAFRHASQASSLDNALTCTNYWTLAALLTAAEMLPTCTRRLSSELLVSLRSHRLPPQPP